MLGGVGAYTRILAHTMAKQGHEVFILTTVQAREDEARIRLSPKIRQWSIGSLNTIRQWAAESRLDVINIQYQTAAYRMSPWIHFIPDNLRKLPVVTTFHDLRFPYLFPKAGRMRDWIVMHLARASDGAIATNHEDMQRLSDLPCTALIPIGSNILQPLPPDFDPQMWRAKAGAAANDLLLAHFGLVNHSKGLDILLEALAILRTDDVPARIVIIGGDAGSSDSTNVNYHREIQAMIERLDLTSYVHITGFLDEETVGKFLAASDMVALPFRDGASYRRGSLMAAIRYGCPIVTTQPTVNIPTFVNGENMLLVPPGDTQGLVEAIHLLHQSPELRKRLKQGASRLASNFDWSQLGQDTVAFFERVIGAKA
jgi:glycosyltransferase involved in cell wall biosynthesis